MLKSNNILGDFWGGTASMLVALPSAIAFGVVVYGSIGGSYISYSAIAGILGVAALGIIIPLLGGTSRLISAPSAPAAAVLSAFVLESVALGIDSSVIFISLMLVALLAGIFQVLFGYVGLGRLIKYIPFPVVSGYLSGVGLYIIASQMPKFLGVPIEWHFLRSLQSPQMWQWQSIVVGFVTMLTMLYGHKILRTIPPVISALTTGLLTYFSLAIFDSSLLQPNNAFVIGELGGSGGMDFFALFVERFRSISLITWDNLMLLIFPALTLATLLSIDTLKTCIVLDSMTHSFHDSNKELIAQGSGNITASLIGGMPGSGTMGPTMINLSSGASSSLSAFVEGVMSIVVFVLLGAFVGWIPVATLAGILIVVGFRMIDKNSARLLRSQKTIFDFFIIISVAITALKVSLIAATGVGLALAAVLYIIQQIGTSIVYRKQDGSEVKSKIVRSEEEESFLSKNSSEFSLYKLHGALFFGTANQLYLALKQDLQHKKYIILDMKRVQSVDLTAAHILLQIKDILHDRGGYLLLSRLPHKLPTGDDVENYFNQVGLLKHLSPIMVFDDLDDAIEWAKERIIKEHTFEKKNETILELSDFEFFKGRNEDTMIEIQNIVEEKSFHKGDIVYKAGDLDGGIFLIRKGSIRIMLPFDDQKSVHLNTLGQGNFFGEFSFLEGSPHYTTSIATTDTHLFMISRNAFKKLSVEHKKASLHFMDALATELATRLREARMELGVEYDV
ncbi:SulP family inorganic anion transporter [Sulfurimonas sp.]|uniref:SulP family inorganic anion transporter n=1 Tax=Sulfurimonas sp. TaxID=2022749 RepID=UPI0025EF069B|nr:SulP family inorganic anion transporter [Sulfurimonas sp.]MDD5157379.1 SulP family inorganic anion transporter [Sulfurimonas sp.]